MRTPRNQITEPAAPAPRRRRPKTKGVIVTGEDVMWWAKTTDREPFVSMANTLRTYRGALPAVCWTEENTMEVAA